MREVSAEQVGRRSGRGVILAIALGVAAGSVGCGFPTYRYTDEDTTFDTGEAPTDATSDAVVPTDTTPVGDGCVPNGCGGCIEGGLAKGVKCGTCGTGTCSGTTVTCTPADPAVGTKCGVCGTSAYTCTPSGTSACASEDDRVTIEDLGVKIRDEQRFVVDRMHEAAITWKVSRLVEYFDLALSLERVPYTCARVAALPHPDPKCDTCSAVTGGFDCTVSAKEVGTLTAIFYTGDPTSGLTEVARATTPIDAAKTTMDWLPIALSPKVPKQTLGSALTIVVTTDSSTWAARLWGTSTTVTPFPAPPAGMTWWTRTTKPTPTAWKEEPATDLALVVRGKACAP